MSAIGVSGAVTAVVSGLLNKRITTATANNSTADYTEKIIRQADERVAQAISDYNRAIKERDEAYAESKGQRNAKRDHRKLAEQLREENHQLQLRVKDVESKLAIAEWHRCEIVACAKRVPPRQG